MLDVLAMLVLVSLGSFFSSMYFGIQMTFCRKPETPYFPREGWGGSLGIAFRPHQLSESGLKYRRKLFVSCCVLIVSWVCAVIVIAVFSPPVTDSPSPREASQETLREAFRPAIAPTPDAAARVREIEKGLRVPGHEFQLRHDSVRWLKEINTDQSRALLRRMALGEFNGGNPNIDRWAANMLVKDAPDEGWTILTSTDPQVLVPALNAVRGQTVDEEKFALLKPFLDNHGRGVDYKAAMVMAHGCDGPLADKAVEVFGEKLNEAMHHPQANKPSPDHPGFTLLELRGLPYIYLLAETHVDNQRLHELAKQLSGRARDAVMIALAMRGDTSVHDALAKLIQDPDAGQFRERALWAFDRIGSVDDIPWLRKIAETDPLIREGELGPPHPVHTRGPTYPVREAASQAIRVIESRKVPNAR